MGILLPFTLVLMSVSSSPPSDACQVQLSRSGQSMTVIGMVDPDIWAQGTYQMNVAVTQGTNRSVSSQSGQFSTAGQNDIRDGAFYKLSTTTVYAGPTGTVSITLTVRGDTREQECQTTMTL